jgi:2-methylcitrate dehydratase PrpD
MSVLEAFAEFSATLQFESLSSEDKEIVGLHLLDTMAAAIAGTGTPIGQSLRSLQIPDARGMTVWTPDTLDDVARRVGTVRHTEIDDIHTSSNVTPSSVIIPTALTMASRLGSIEPDTVASAIVAGYEAILRLGMVIDGPVVMYKGIWPTFFCTPFGTAAVTARLLGLSPAATAQSLANALTLCTGGAGAPGPGLPGRWFVVGEAARAGVGAALAAAAGFTADLGLLDGDWLNQAHGMQGFPERMTDGLNNGSIVADLSMKQCCTAKQVASALAAFCDLLEDGLDAETVGAIDVFVPQRYAAMIDRRIMPGGNLPTAINTRYQLALAAFHPEGLFDAARTEAIDDPRLNTLMGKTSIRVGESLDVHMPRCWPARVEAVTPAGRVVKSVIAAPGDPDRRFGLPDVVDKFHAVTDRLIGRDASDDWIAAGEGALTNSAALEPLMTKFDDLFDWTCTAKVESYLLT